MYKKLAYDTNYRMKNINSDYGEFVDITALNS